MSQYLFRNGAQKGAYNITSPLIAYYYKINLLFFYGTEYFFKRVSFFEQ